MNIFPEVEKQIGFDLIRKQLETFCKGEAGVKKVHQFKFLSDYQLIRDQLIITEEYKTLLEQTEFGGIGEYDEVRQLVKKSQIPGAFLSVEEILTIRKILQHVQDLQNNIFQNDLDLPLLRELVSVIEINITLLYDIDKTINENGEISNDATPELRRIRQQVISERSSLRKLIEHNMKQAIANGYADEDVQPTIRGGRMVIPVRSENKRIIRGLIHGESNTGQTAYVEPDQAFDANNRLVELEMEERRELMKILTRLTQEIKRDAVEILEMFTVLAEVDFIQAKARFAQKIHACRPELSKSPGASVSEGYHPWLIYKMGKSNVVPSSYKLTDLSKVIIVSGPNAGGKSVFLKTVGLLQYMVQCGLLAPVESSSSFGIFQKIMVEIGDHQSVDNELSTYSAHLRSVRDLLEHVDEHTLFLIDEFGSGTDPDYGGAIAEAVLEQLVRQQGYGVVTTHYQNLKKISDRIGSVVNASMQYDNESLRPLYRFSAGEPGSSFALEIAYNMGLPQEVINRAEKVIGKERIQYDQALKSLQQQKVNLEALLDKNEKERNYLSKTVAEYREMKRLIESQRSRKLSEAKKEAHQIIEDANKRIENTVRQIKEKNAEKDALKKERQELKSYQDGLLVKEEPAKPKKTEVKELKNQPVEVGDQVKVLTTDFIGEVVAIKNNKATIGSGVMKMQVPLKELVKVRVRKKTPLRSNVADNLRTHTQQQRSDLDVRGQRADQAIKEVEQFVDQCMMTGAERVRIIHGKGNGILRNQIRTYLKSFDKIRFFNEHPDHGGDGVTILEFD